MADLIFPRLSTNASTLGSFLFTSIQDTETFV